MYLTNSFFWRTVLIKNKLFTTGIAALTLAFAIVIMGCDTEATQVEGTVTADLAKAAAPGTPDVMSSTVNPGSGYSFYSHEYSVTWTAADGGVSYILYVRQEGKKTINSLSPTDVPTNVTMYLTADQAFGISNATDSDAWNARVTVSTSSTAIQVSKNIRIGVRATNARNQVSDIVWSGAIAF
jgi:hypothetical protein